MAFPTWLWTWKTHLEGRKTLRTRHQSAARKLATVKLRLEQLEDRLVLSGFGPADGAYIEEPWNGGYAAVRIQPGDQKIVAAGDANPNNDNTDVRMAIARYDALGNPDNTYGSGGPSIPPLSGVSAPALGSSKENGWDLVLQPDGKAVVSGLNWVSSSVNSSFAVARFNTSGTLDSGFGNGGWNSLDARADYFNPAEGVGLQSTGKVVVVGPSIGQYTNPAEVARFTAGGTVNTGGGGFGPQKKGYTLTDFGMPTNIFHDLAVQPDDKLVAVGGHVVARYTASGTLDNTFNGNGYSVFLPTVSSGAAAFGVALQSNGKIVVTGTDNSASDMLVVRYNANGTLDTSFGGGSGYVRLDVGAASQSSGRDVAIQPDGKIVVVGGTTSGTGNPGNVLVARFNVDGTPDGTFAPGGFKIGAPLFEGRGLALQSDGSIIVAGNHDGHPALMRFFGSTPQIGSFRARPNPVIAGADVMLTAANVVNRNPGGSVVQVAFYQDANGDGILQAGTDLLLGYGTPSSPGTWTLTFSTTGRTAGTYTFFALALDSHGLFSDPLATTVQVL